MKTAKEIYRELDEEFCKGSPKSKLNNKCKTHEDLIVYAMEEYAEQFKIKENTLIGKEFYLDLDSVAPVEVKIKEITDTKVIVDYLSSSPSREEEFLIKDFNYFAGTNIKENNYSCKFCDNSGCYGECLLRKEKSEK